MAKVVPMEIQTLLSAGCFPALEFAGQNSAEHWLRILNQLRLYKPWEKVDRLVSPRKLAGL